MQRELFGEEHPHIATSLGNLGAWYARNGDPQRALEYSEQALTMRLQLLGDRHPDIASSLSGIGHCYEEQGDLKRSLQHLEQALRMRRDLFGDRHPDIAISLRNLGAFHREQSDLEQALQYSEEALAMYQHIFGERHSFTVEEARRVAIDLARLNRRKNAFELVRHFLPLAQGQLKDQLKYLQTQLLSQPIQPGFRQPSKSGKRKGKKKRR